MEAAIVVTYRCDNRCRMCGTWKYPTRPEEEFAPGLLRKLPRLSFCNVTGGEPFLRDDIEEIVSILSGKAGRIVISTNGYHSDRILALARRHPRLGFRVSLEGLPAVNDELRGRPDGFDHGLRTLLELQAAGIADIGFGITISDRNAGDLLALYRLSRRLGLEFATAAVHNSYYFHATDNAFRNPDGVSAAIAELIAAQLREKNVKSWFRAYFNHGLIGYVRGRERLLPCGAGTEMFFLDPFGEIRPCNGMEDGVWLDSFGSLHDRDFDEIWNSPKAVEIREKVRTCPKNCWMIGTAGPAMKKNIRKPLAWIARRKMGRPVERTT
jgi:radical SAM protein with 4Fe4S-binding SPASM domain